MQDYVSFSLPNYLVVCSVVWDFSPSLNGTDNLEIRPHSVTADSTGFGQQSSEVPQCTHYAQGFYFLRCRQCIKLFCKIICAAVNTVFFTHLVVMLCVYFGEGVWVCIQYLLCTGTGLRRTSDAEVLKIYCLWQCFHIKTNMDVSLINGPIHYIQ